MKAGSGTEQADTLCWFVFRGFQPLLGEALRIWADLRADLLWAGGWTRDLLRSLPVWTILWSCSCPPDRLLENCLPLFAFSEFWSQLSSRIKSTMVRKSCEIVLSLKVLRSEHYDKEHDAGGDSFESPVWSSLFSQATSWQDIPLLQSRIKERRKLGSWFG